MTDSGPTFVGPQADSQPRAGARLDVVFVHGLTGDRFSTWQADSQASFWPGWLATDFTDINFYTAGYDSSLFAKVFVGGGSTIIDRATMLLDSLLSRPVSAPNVIFVAHSLGGLIVKQMLRRCHDSALAGHKQFLSSVRGVVFLGTPHQGAQAASSISSVLNLVLSTSVKQLAYGAEQLDDLNEWFRNWAGHTPVTIRAYYETDKTKGLTVVDKVTANPHVHGCEPIALPSDHIGMCKPLSREAQLYQSMSALLRETVVLLTPISAPSTAVAPPVSVPPGLSQIVSGNGFGWEGAVEPVGLQPEILVDYQNFTAVAPDDRRSLAEKLTAAGREYQVRDGERKKERFSMMLQRHIAQPSALTHFIRMMAEIEARFNRHVLREVTSGGSLAAVDKIIQEDVVDPVLKTYGAQETQISASTVDGALYYLAGNCHLRWDNGKD